MSFDLTKFSLVLIIICGFAYLCNRYNRSNDVYIYIGFRERKWKEIEINKALELRLKKYA